MLPTADAGGCSGVRDGILVRLHENRAEVVELLDFGWGKGAIVDADVVNGVGLISRVR